jgi:hypothetical protein
MDGRQRLRETVGLRCSQSRVNSQNAPSTPPTDQSAAPGSGGERGGVAGRASQPQKSSGRGQKAVFMAKCTVGELSWRFLSIYPTSQTVWAASQTIWAAFRAVWATSQTSWAAFQTSWATAQTVPGASHTIRAAPQIIWATARMGWAALRPERPGADRNPSGGTPQNVGRCLLSLGSPRVCCCLILEPVTLLLGK